MAVNKKLFTGRAGPLKVRQLTKPQISELAHGIYHEARHAEQQFKVAQYLAGQEKSDIDIAYEMRIPLPIAKQAKAKPLRGISPMWEEINIFLNEELETALGDDPKDIAKRTQDFRKKVAENNQMIRQVEAWHQEMPLNELIYDHYYKIRGALATITQEAEKRKRGNWDTTKLLPAVNVLKNDVIPQFEREIQRVSAQANRSEMLTHLTDFKKSCVDIVTFVEQQVNSQSLILEFEMISLNAQVIRANLEVAQKHILTEADAYEQGNKVEAAFKAKSGRRR